MCRSLLVPLTLLAVIVPALSSAQDAPTPPELPWGAWCSQNAGHRIACVLGAPILALDTLGRELERRCEEGGGAYEVVSLAYEHQWGCVDGPGPPDRS